MELKKSVASVGVGLLALAAVVVPGYAAAAPEHVVSVQSLPVAVVGQPYTVALSDVGGTGVVWWGTLSGQLPSGLSLDVRSGVISGVPTAASVALVPIGATDDGDDMAVVSLVIGVTDPNAAPVPVAAVAPAVVVPMIPVEPGE